MAPSNPRKSDLLRRSSSSAASTSTRPQSASAVADKNVNRGNFGSMTVDSILRDAYESGPTTESTLLDAQITLIETPANATARATSAEGSAGGSSLHSSKTMDDVWKDMISGERRECKEEALDEMMTLEDFLAKAGAVDDDDDDVKLPVAPIDQVSGGIFTFDSINPTTFHSLDKVEGSVVGFGNGLEVGSGGGERNKRGRPVLEPLNKAALQRQRRMIKNRESAARSRERKQAYQVELESIAVKLEEENEQLMREKVLRCGPFHNWLREPRKDTSSSWKELFLLLKSKSNHVYSAGFDLGSGRSNFLEVQNGNRGSASDDVAQGMTN